MIDDAAINLSVSELLNAYLMRVIFDDGGDPFCYDQFCWIGWCRLHVLMRLGVVNIWLAHTGQIILLQKYASLFQFSILGYFENTNQSPTFLLYLYY